MIELGGTSETGNYNSAASRYVVAGRLDCQCLPSTPKKSCSHAVYSFAYILYITYTGVNHKCHLETLLLLNLHFLQDTAVVDKINMRRETHTCGHSNISLVNF